MYTSLGLFLSWAKNQWIQLMSQGTMLVKAGIGAQTAFGGSWGPALPLALSYTPCLHQMHCTNELYMQHVSQRFIFLREITRRKTSKESFGLISVIFSEDESLAVSLSAWKTHSCHSLFGINIWICYTGKKLYICMYIMDGAGKSSVKLQWAGHVGHRKGGWGWGWLEEVDGVAGWQVGWMILMVSSNLSDFMTVSASRNWRTAWMWKMLLTNPYCQGEERLGSLWVSPRAVCHQP